MSYRSPSLSVSGFGRFLFGFALIVLISPVLLLFILAIPVLNLLGLNKSGAGPEYVADHLQAFADGTEDGWDWDDFCSVPLRDDRLDALRAAACEFAPPYPLGDEERAELRRLLAQVRAL